MVKIPAKGIKKWVLGFILTPIFFLSPSLQSHDFLDIFPKLSAPSFKYILEQEFQTMESIESLQTQNAIMHAWHAFMRPIQLDRSNPYPIYSLLFHPNFANRVEKFQLYLLYGGAAKILDYEDVFFSTLTNYFLYRKEILSLEHVQILKKFLAFKGNFLLPWKDSYLSTLEFQKARSDWTKLYGIRLASHFLKNGDWKAYRSMMRGYFAHAGMDNKSLLFPDGEFLPIIPEFLDLLKRNKDPAIGNNFKWTLNKLGDKMLANYVKNPEQLHEVLSKLGHEIHSLVNNGNTSWEYFKGSYHLFHFAKYNNKDFYEWLIFYYDFRCLAHLLHFKYTQKIPTYPNNRNLLHQILSSDHDTEKMQGLSSQEQDYRIQRLLGRVLWNDQFPIIERLNALLTRDAIHLRTPIEFIDPKLRPRAYRTLRHFQCVYESWKFWGTH